MSPKSIQQKSIKDHFAIIPKKKVEPKLYPLFLKKKAVIEDRVKEDTIVSKPPPSPIVPTPNQRPKKQQLTSPERPNTPLPKKLCSRPHPLQELLNTNTTHFFRRQKTVREACQRESKNPINTTQSSFDQRSIEDWMNEYYPQWRKEPCCEYLYRNIPNLKKSNQIQWVNKYRPNTIDGLIGFLPDFEYLREWLDKIKVTHHDTVADIEDLKKRKKKLTMSKDEDELYNLILFIGDHGTGKTATAYTVAYEMGYTVFEINSTSRRAGKDILNQVGEMTASHLVRFNHKKRKNKGETIILRDMVVNKKPKTIDIATHFKRMLIVSNNKEEEEAEGIKKNEVAKEDVIVEEVQTKEKIKKSASIDSFFIKSSSIKKTTITENNALDEGVMMTETCTELVKDESKAVKEEEEDIIMEDAPKQSLVLLEEVDLLFEEDKGFWTAVIELCQKSKRPIIMTCNDESNIPFDHLDIQAKILFDLSEKSSLLPYLQLICFSENYIVKPYDIECICELYNFDTRRIISALQLYLSPHSKDEYIECPALFAQIMGFSDLIEEVNSKETVVILMDRLKGLNEKVKELCIKYYYQLLPREEETTEIDIICEMMETASFADAWIGLTDKQRHQIYDIDQYDDETDMIVSTNDNFIYKNATDLDHWELGEIIENSISVMNLNRKSIIWSNHISAWSSHWEHLYDTRNSLLVDCIKKSVCPLILSYPYYIGSLAVFMMEYMPNIRSICLNDEKSAEKPKRRKKRSRYIKLDDESRDIINWQQI